MWTYFPTFVDLFSNRGRFFRGRFFRGLFFPNTSEEDRAMTSGNMRDEVGSCLM